MNLKGEGEIPVAAATFPAGIAERALASADRFLIAATPALAGAAVELRAGNVDAGLAAVTRILDGLVSLASLSNDLGQVAPRAVTVPVEEFRDVIRTIVEVEERRDWNALADALERGLVPRLSRWREIFARAL
jgi:hypothetical protein